MAGDTDPCNEVGWFSPRLFRSADLEGNDGGSSSVVGIQAAGISPIGYDAEGETPQDLLELTTNQKDEQLPQIATAEQAMVEISILQTQDTNLQFQLQNRSASTATAKTGRHRNSTATHTQGKQTG
jgi:hypothetical protein